MRVLNAPIPSVECIYAESHTWNANNHCTSPYTCSVMLVYYNVFGNGRQIIQRQAHSILFSFIIYSCSRAYLNLHESKLSIHVECHGKFHMYVKMLQ